MEILTLMVSKEFADKVTEIAESKNTSITEVMVKATETNSKLLDALIIAHDIIALRHAERPELTLIKNAIQKATK